MDGGLALIFMAVIVLAVIGLLFGVLGGNKPWR